MANRALTFYARQFLTEPAAFRKKIVTPILIWEAPPEDANKELMFGTVSGAASPRPTSRDPLVFEVKKGTSKQNAFGFGITVGRTENNDIPLDDNSVSRFHAYFQEDPKKGLLLSDADSRNGTFVNGEKLKAKSPVAVKPGAKLRFGSIDMTLYSPDAFFKFLETKMNG